ncbi:hypothetical protein O181_037204 [Austropuccinia psidii MF-1]|uniref:Uncharacterized protein n=1 Tax=Austropuccinia psidii MF-1 TaxID=1389203 RepID=A0A9Q3D633_9BASI|nr:hypothetical protein [Austropuccinia psidii MF-1]
MSPVHLTNLGLQRNQPEDREAFSRTRRPGGGHLGHGGGWQDIEGNHTHSAIHFTIHQKPQTRGLEGYGSSSSAPPTPQRPFSMEHGQQEVQPSLPTDQSLEQVFRRYVSKRYTSKTLCYRRTADPDRAYSDSFRLTRSRPNQLSSGFTQFRNQQISGQESPLFTIPGFLKEKTRIQGQEQDLFQVKEVRVRPNDPEAVGLGEGSTQEPEIVVHTYRISSSISRNITPTQIEHNFVTSEINLNSDSLLLKMSQYAEQTQRQFADLQASHERMKILTASMDKIVKTLQEGYAQLSKAS